MAVVSGFAEPEAAKQLLLDGLRSGVAEADVVSTLRQLEVFRNSLWRADHVLIQAAERYGLAEKH